MFQVSGPKHLLELARTSIEQRVQTGGKGQGANKGKSKSKGKSKPFHTLPSVVTWFSGPAAHR